MAAQRIGKKGSKVLISKKLQVISHYEDAVATISFSCIKSKVQNKKSLAFKKVYSQEP